jgi:pilus assembly protein CpaB
MNSRAMTLSLVMAGIAVFFVMSSVSSIEQSATMKYGDEVTVLVAKQDIREMATILDSMVEAKSVPRNFVEPTAVKFDGKLDVDSAEGASAYSIQSKRIVGNVAIVAIKKGEQLTLNKITEPSMRTGLAPQVTPGKRAIAVPIDESTSVAKLVKPGDRVDVIAVVQSPGVGGRDVKTAKTVFQDVVILAVGRSIANNVARRVDVDMSGTARVRSLTEYDGYSSVTLELDPTQAQLVAAIYTDNSNRLILSLRNNDDADRVAISAPSRATDVLTDSQRLPASSSGGLK